MYKNTKPMLDVNEQIEHLVLKGVKFEIKSKEEAKRYLEKNNNYFKLTSYRKNFQKYESGINKGKYINLDFEMLSDLSIIDMILRKTILSIVLDIEHYSKVRILKKISSTTKDGYTIVEEYIKYLKTIGKYGELQNELDRDKQNTYCGDIVNKYENEYPVWAFIEIIPFGRFIDFYKFVAIAFNDRKMIDEAYLLKNVRELRNACAHNNCVLNDLRANTTKHNTNYDVSSAIERLGIPRTTVRKKTSNPRIQQIVTLLYLNKIMITSDGVLEHQTKILQELKSRIEYHINYYSKNLLVKTNLEFLNKIIDNWYTKRV